MDITLSIISYFALWVTLGYMIFLLVEQWRVWGKEMSPYADKELLRRMERLKAKPASDAEDGQQTSYRLEDAVMDVHPENEHAYQVLLEHVQDFTRFESSYAAVIEASDNLLFRTRIGSYRVLLMALIKRWEEIFMHRPSKADRRFRKMAARLDKVKDDITILVKERQTQDGFTRGGTDDQETKRDHQADNARSSSYASSIYFVGCDTLDKLEKRYRSLCKAYHPDAGFGSEEAFKAMSEEYRIIREEMS
jgi:hypothetical protein